MRYATRAVGLARTDHGWTIEIDNEGTQQHISTKSVVMATGGFHANLKWRSMYLGPNKAQPLDTGPFVAYAVTCGITCTYGGVKINPTGQVLDEFDQPISGLYAAGEMVGGLYYTKYAGGAGLTAGSVLGRISGEHAANLAKNKIKN